ncbi:CFI-box-CTERM domain-containing protein [Sulfuricystis multivorans]|uniref:CFI-box-CTERM domain-containing protein n=1 Tax=Sulfuricystis multivorans TaxID=2211108 RepID=UPI000F832FEB|nr:CFI-box-CTERM domain-containing protein [Sulfuricystis multivorans]
MEAFKKFLACCAGLFLAFAVHAATLKDLHAAGELLAEGRHAAAEARLDRIVKEGVDETLIGDVMTDQAQTMRAIARIAQGKLEAAAEDAVALAKPRSSLTVPEAAVRLDALILLRRGERGAALAAYDRAVEMASIGMASGARRANMLALRAWAKLVFGDVAAAREDFEAAVASDGVVLFTDDLALQKPFWRAVIDEALPLFAAGKMQEGLDRVDAIVKRLDLLGKLRESDKKGGTTEGHSAKSILWYELQGPVAALRAKSAEIARARAEEAQRARLTEAQRALLQNDPQRAFDLFVAAFRDARDADARDRAIAGLATVVKLLPGKPPVPEALRRLLVKAKVLVEEKDYAGAIALYAEAYRTAPWHAPLFYDRALLIGQVARSQADFDAAMREMRRFLTLAPDAPDARAAQDKIYEWEVKRERAAQALPEITPRAHGVSATAAGAEGCFIATAAFGSPWESHVATLRAFRDRHLLTNAPGRWFVARYYQLSPPVADFIRERESLRALVRALLTPVVFAVEQPGVASALLLAALLGVAAWRRRCA